MTSEQIGKLLEGGYLANDTLKIDFKGRQSIMGLFIKLADYDELKKKNFWRVVSEAHIPKWKDSHDNNLCRLFNGSEITKLTKPNNH